MAPRPDAHRSAGKLIVGGFHGPVLPAEVARRLTAGELGGIILFKRNLESLEQIVQLTRAIQSTRGDGDAPFIIGVDQEGGGVARLRGLVTDLPSMAVLGQTGDPQLCADLGEMVGIELGALGINTVFAPVMDVDARLDEPARGHETHSDGSVRSAIIGERSFSKDPHEVARLAGAFATGLLVGGVLPCAKHFPGHGHAAEDSHHVLPVVHAGVDELESSALVPFRAVIRTGLPAIMVGHLLVPAIDAELPASLSHPTISHLLRQQMGFEGVVISDCLEMAALADRFSTAEIVAHGLHAGLDLFLISHSPGMQRVALDVLRREAETSRASNARLGAAVQRVERLRNDFLVSSVPDESHWRAVVRSSAHRELVRRIERLNPDGAWADGQEAK